MKLNFGKFLAKVKIKHMSGHSHWATVKHKKALIDARRGKVFSKLARAIEVAAREKGPDSASNPKLRIAVEQARSINFPKENIERAIKKGTGQLEGVQLEEVMLEAYGPGKTAIMIEGITDNKNRTLNEIKQILTKHQGKLAQSGSVQWMFERKGVIIISPEPGARSPKDKENLEMTAIESGAEDIYWHDDVLDIYTKPEELEKVKLALEEKGIKIESSSLDWVAKEMIEVQEKDRETCQKLFEALDENEAVQEIYSNLKA